MMKGIGSCYQNQVHFRVLNNFLPVCCYQQGTIFPARLFEWCLSPGSKGDDCCILCRVTNFSPVRSADVAGGAQDAHFEFHWIFPLGGQYPGPSFRLALIGSRKETGAWQTGCSLPEVPKVHQTGRFVTMQESSIRWNPASGYPGDQGVRFGTPNHIPYLATNSCGETP